MVVAVEYSTVNWKDGLCLGSGGGLVRNYPHVLVLIFGTVESSDDPRYNQGDKVILTGWRVEHIGWIFSKPESKLIGLFRCPLA